MSSLVQGNVKVWFAASLVVALLSGCAQSGCGGGASSGVAFFGGCRIGSQF